MSRAGSAGPIAAPSCGNVVSRSASRVIPRRSRYGHHGLRSRGGQQADQPLHAVHTPDRHSSPANGRAKARSPTHISSPFVEIYDRWTPEPDVTLPVPIDRRVPPLGSTSGDAQVGDITHPKSAVWATAFNHHYRMLLAWLQLSMRSPSPAREPLHCTAPSSFRRDVHPVRYRPASPPAAPQRRRQQRTSRCSVRTPYSLAVPDQQTDHWTFTLTTWPSANR